MKDVRACVCAFVRVCVCTGKEEEKYLDYLLHEIPSGDALLCFLDAPVNHEGLNHWLLLACSNQT